MLEYRTDIALVSVKLPDGWNDSTFVKNTRASVTMKPGETHPSMKNMTSMDVDMLASEFNVLPSSLRQVAYKDYEHGDLPKQNTQASGRRNMEDLFHQHPPAILYNLKVSLVFARQSIEFQRRSHGVSHAFRVCCHATGTPFSTTAVY